MKILPVLSSILSLFFAATLLADHKPDLEWSWHVQSAGIDESRLVVHQRDRRFAIYNLACDLGNVTEGEAGDDNASIQLVALQAVSDALLIVSCNVGAHARQITILDLDLERKSPQPAFSATGSYRADWEIQDDELWISYDEPCDTGLSVDCPDGYVTIFVQYPEAAPAD